MPTLVKICGLKTAPALDAALDAKADFVGFVFFPASPRHVEIDSAHAFGERVQGRAKKVALTVDADDATFAAIVAALKPDLLQLHGEETPERVFELRARFGLPVMKALPVETATDLAAAAAYQDVANWLLFDARAPKEATRPGGLGRPFDWNLLKGLIRAALHAFRGARSGQCRAGAGDHAGARSRCIVRGRKRTGPRGPLENQGIRARGARGGSGAVRGQGCEQRMNIQQPNSFRTGPTTTGISVSMADALSPRR